MPVANSDQAPVVATACIRFVAKKIGNGKKAPWRVYDRQNGSYPYRTGELGVVVQDATEAEILAECERLNAAHRAVGSKPKRAASSRTDQADSD